MQIVIVNACDFMIYECKATKKNEQIASFFRHITFFIPIHFGNFIRFIITYRGVIVQLIDYIVRGKYFSLHKRILKPKIQLQIVVELCILKSSNSTTI